MLCMYNSLKGVEYRSPIYYHLWFTDNPDGKTQYQAKTPYWVTHEDKKVIKNIDTGETEYEVRSGFFHTYKYKEDAEFAFRNFGGDWKRAIVKCVIPKGTVYYEGVFGDAYSYASPYLKVTKILSQSE